MACLPSGVQINLTLMNKYIYGEYFDNSDASFDKVSSTYMQYCHESIVLVLFRPKSAHNLALLLPKAKDGANIHSYRKKFTLLP